MVTRLYLIRHGETEDAGLRRYKGHLDVPLSERGIRQMEAVAKYLKMEDGKGKMEDITGVYCSDLKRAIQSAEIIAKPLGLKPVVVSELRERNFGQWEGMTFEEIAKKWPDTFKAWAEDPLRHSPPGGESTLEVRERVIDALDKILKELQSGSSWFKKVVQDSSKIVQNGSKVDNNTTLNNIEQSLTTLNQIIIVVAHGGVNRVILAELLGMPLENIFRIEQDYACVNIIDFHDGYPVVKGFNIVQDNSRWFKGDQKKI